MITSLIQRGEDILKIKDYKNTTVETQKRPYYSGTLFRAAAGILVCQTVILSGSFRRDLCVHFQCNFLQCQSFTTTAMYLVKPSSLSIESWFQMASGWLDNILKLYYHLQNIVHRKYYYAILSEYYQY